MKYNSHKSLLSLTFILLFVTGCTTFQIVDLKPETVNSVDSDYSTNAIAGVETLQVVSSEYNDLLIGIKDWPMRCVKRCF